VAETAPDYVLRIWRTDTSIWVTDLFLIFFSSLYTYLTILFTTNNPILFFINSISDSEAWLIIIAFTSVLPTVFHLLLTFIFLLSKIFRPVLKPIVSRLLYLFYVSPKGVLSQLAVAGAIVTKGGQQLIKYLS
jgi:hypothetical protein